jgi:hypothetical protein
LSRTLVDLLPGISHSRGIAEEERTETLLTEISSLTPGDACRSLATARTGRTGIVAGWKIEN